MKIGVISDTHGRIDSWKQAERLLVDADLIVHAGDVLYHPPRLGCTMGYDIPAMVEALNGSPIPIVIAQGNCDAQVYEELLDIPIQHPYAYVEIQDIRILVHHGHLFQESQLIHLGRKYKADVVVTGHTHVPVLKKTDGLILFNPGSPSIPKFERKGKLIGSVGIITDDAAKILDVDSGETLFEISR